MRIPEFQVHLNRFIYLFVVLFANLHPVLGKSYSRPEHIRWVPNKHELSLVLQIKSDFIVLNHSPMLLKLPLHQFDQYCYILCSHQTCLKYFPRWNGLCRVLVAHFSETELGDQAYVDWLENIVVEVENKHSLAPNKLI